MRRSRKQSEIKEFFQANNLGPGSLILIKADTDCEYLKHSTSRPIRLNLNSMYEKTSHTLFCILDCGVEADQHNYSGVWIDFYWINVIDPATKLIYIIRFDMDSIVAESPHMWFKVVKQ